MKKNIFCTVLLIFSLCTFFAYTQFKNFTVDTTPPTLICESDTIKTSVAATEVELLEGITAVDKRSGDVSDTLVIEDISNFIGDSKRIITYAAIDDSMNVGRLERTLIYTDYSAPRFSLKAPLSYSIGSKVNILENVGASSKLDGDLSNKIRYGLDLMIDNLTPGKYPIEFRVTDSCGKTAYFNTDIEIYDTSYSGIRVNLTDYLIYLPVGSEFVKQSYFKNSNIKGTLSIVSNVNTKKPGTYYVDYFVNAVNTNGKSRLTVVVY